MRAAPAVVVVATTPLLSACGNSDGSSSPGVGSATGTLASGTIESCDLRVKPSAETAARAVECFDDPGEHLRKGNIEIWERFAASPAVLEAARLALADLP